MKQFVMTMAVSLFTAMAWLPSAFAELEIHEEQGVRYVTGGMSEQERKEMGKLASRFPIHMVFVDPGKDEPLSGVKVKVFDVSGNLVLQSVSAGPIFFVDVVGGRYTVEVEHEGRKQSETKDLTGRRYLRLRYDFSE